MKKQQSGFTMIELIMVIVILGILAAFAIPKFANLGADARRSTIQGAEGSMKSASAIAHSAFLAAGTNPATVNLEGTDVGLVNGYPSATGIILAANITGGALATDDGDFIVITDTTTATVQAKGAATAGSCQVVYTQATSTTTAGVTIITPPTVASTVTGC